jgi:hypothetical protein
MRITILKTGNKCDGGTVPIFSLSRLRVNKKRFVDEVIDYGFE